ncbi:MAG: hypothetical protein MUP25_05470, partial [Syntrophales bacterium]|nr:hypothetical protein [Syntrophales bacterium]
PLGSGGKLLCLRGCPGSMINISQIEKITESEVPSGSLSSRTATDPGSYPEQYGKKYLLPGRPGGVHIYGILW